jgi:hypothetical protein
MTKRLHTLAELDTSNPYLRLDCTVALVDISATACPAARCKGQPREQRLRPANRSQLRCTPATTNHLQNRPLLSRAKIEPDDSRGTSAREYPAPKTNMSIHKITAGDVHDSQLRLRLRCCLERGDVRLRLGNPSSKNLTAALLFIRRTKSQLSGTYCSRERQHALLQPDSALSDPRVYWRGHACRCRDLELPVDDTRVQCSVASNTAEL